MGRFPPPSSPRSARPTTFAKHFRHRAPAIGLRPCYSSRQHVSPPRRPPRRILPRPARPGKICLRRGIRAASRKLGILPDSAEWLPASLLPVRQRTDTPWWQRLQFKLFKRSTLHRFTIHTPCSMPSPPLTNHFSLSLPSRSL